MPKSSIDVTAKGWMPEATKVAVPASNFSVGCVTRDAVVLHISEGTALSALSWFKNPTAQVSSHFVVTDAGQIYQCVSVLDTAYANGLSWNAAQHCWVDPEKHLLKAPNPSPAWPGLTPPTNPNVTTISIEREGHFQDHPSAAENAAVVRILQYVHEQFPNALPAWAFMRTLIGHCHISPVARANCPGPHVDYAGLAAAANGPAPASPSPVTRYRVKADMFWLEDRRPDAPIANQGRALLRVGDVVAINDVTGGWAHAANGIGFTLLSGLEPVQ